MVSGTTSAREPAIVAVDHGEARARDVDAVVDGEAIEDASARDLEPRARRGRADVAHGPELLDDAGEHLEISFDRDVFAKASDAHVLQLGSCQ